MTDNTPSYPILLHYAILIRSRDLILLRSMVNSYSNQDQSSALKVLFRINYFTFGRFFNIMILWRNYIYSYCSSLMMEVSVYKKLYIMSVTEKKLRINKNVIKKNEDLNQCNKKIERKILFVS